MKSLLFCCLFGAFLATGMGIECDMCMELGLNCSGWKRTCNAKEDTCVTFQTEVIRAPLSITFTSKACGTSDTCNLDYMQGTIHNDLTVRSKRVCCTGDECDTLPPPVLKPLVKQHNGLKCPACFGLTSMECVEHLVSCQESENQCVSLSAKRSDFFVREVSFKACASESLCTFLKRKDWGFFDGLDVEVKCTPALPQSSYISDA